MENVYEGEQRGRERRTPPPTCARRRRNGATDTPSTTASDDPQQQHAPGLGGGDVAPRRRVERIAQRAGDWPPRRTDAKAATEPTSSDTHAHSSRRHGPRREPTPAVPCMIHQPAAEEQRWHPTSDRNRATPYHQRTDGAARTPLRTWSSRCLRRRPRRGGADLEAERTVHHVAVGGGDPPDDGVQPVVQRGHRHRRRSCRRRPRPASRARPRRRRRRTTGCSARSASIASSKSSTICGGAGFEHPVGGRRCWTQAACAYAPSATTDDRQHDAQRVSERRPRTTSRARRCRWQPSTASCASPMGADQGPPRPGLRRTCGRSAMRVRW